MSSGLRESMVTRFGAFCGGIDEEEFVVGLPRLNFYVHC